MKRKVSFVIPLYNEAQSLKELLSAIIENFDIAAQEKLVDSYEIIFIDDGSTDGSREEIVRLSKTNKNIKIIIFRGNFGKTKALQAGFDFASGDIIITMDADLQDDPTEIIKFIQKIDEGYDLVSGWKFKRLDPTEKLFASKIFNAITRKTTGVNLHDFNCGYKAYTKDVVKSLSLYGDQHRYIPVIAKRYGFRIAELKVHHQERKFGKSKYGLERWLKGFLDSVTTTLMLHYNNRPMYFFGTLGLVFSFIGFLINSYLTVLWFMGESIGSRPILLLGTLLILVGVQFFSTGFIADMILDNRSKESKNHSHIAEFINLND